MLSLFFDMGFEYECGVAHVPRDVDISHIMICKKSINVERLRYKYFDPYTDEWWYINIKYKIFCFSKSIKMLKPF